MEISAWWWLVPVGSFAVLEAAAIFNWAKAETASSVLRRLAGIKPLRPWRPIGIAAVIASCTWLAHHLIVG